MQHDISNLMTGQWATRNRGNDVQESTKLPLLLSQAMEGHPITSQSHFLSLPLEILAEIMALIANDKPALSSLALVNSDCRQLARSYQFVEVCFDYGPRSTRLLQRLVDEAQARANGASSTTASLFIGSCIRQVTVQPASRHVAAAHKELWEANWGNPGSTVSQQKMDELRSNAAQEYLLNYRQPILKVLEQAMPNLDSLWWNDEMCLDIEAFEILASLPLQTLEFSGAYAGGLLSLESPLGSNATQLQSLSLGISSCKDSMHARGVTSCGKAKKSDRPSSPTSSFLQHSCESLESLTIKASGSKVEKFRGHETMTFPRLRYLDLASGTSYPDLVAWSSFLAAPLRHLSLPLNGPNTSEKYMSDCPTFEDLETLVVPSLSMDTELAKLISDFVLQHTHVSKLSVQNSAPYFLDQQILPALAGGEWSNLTSLSISWRYPETESCCSGTPQQTYTYIPAESLAAIASIKSLEQLCISAGEAIDEVDGWRQFWLADHDDFRMRLQGLENLQKLAFSRDTYMIPDKMPFLDIESYYDDQWVTQAEFNDAEALPNFGPVDQGLKQRQEARTESADGDDVDNYGFEVDDYDIDIHADVNNFAPNDLVWERAHLYRMLKEAEQYAAVFPNLKWVFCGQWPMSVETKEEEEEKTFQAKPLANKRDTEGKVLVPIFEMKGSN
ncbi:hypothetical protein GGI42DRAFT_342975 [Trichoderma sp. SZMC 28013]